MSLIHKKDGFIKKNTKNIKRFKFKIKRKRKLYPHYTQKKMYIYIHIRKTNKH